MKNLVTKLVLVVAVLISTTSIAAAQQAISTEKRALIKELLEVTGEPKTSEAIFSAVMKQYETEVSKITAEIIKSEQLFSEADKEKLLEDINKEIPRMVKRYAALFTERVNFPRFLEQAVYPLYNKYFTENELRDMIAFYRTETGKKTIEVMPALAAESISKSMDFLMPVMKEIEEEMRRDVEQLVKGKLSNTKKKPGKS